VVHAPAPALQVETVSDLPALVALGPAWDRLLEAAGIDHPFLTHEWMVSFWECFAAGSELHVVVVRDGGEVVAVAPFMAAPATFYGLKVRRLQLISNVHVQRADFIVAAGAERAYAAIWDHLERQRPRWDVLVLPQLPAGSATLERLPRLARARGARCGTWLSTRSPWVRLNGTWEGYLAGRPRKHRSNLRNRMKRLGQLGPVELEIVTGGPQLEEAVDAGLDLEAAGWKGQAGTAIRCTPERHRFYMRLAARAAERGWLRLQFLRAGGRRIAFGYALCFGGTLYLLKPGYDPAYAAYSPSNLLCAMVLQDAFASGLRAYDLLGDDDAWKLDWTEEVRPHSWLFVFARGPRGRLLHWLKFVVAPRVRRARAAWRARRAVGSAAEES
jgi:CelD/BcsL family acetyltransferase involved in cellulose biosynthesis